jgi:phage tail protein X
MIVTDQFGYRYYFTGLRETVDQIAFRLFKTHAGTAEAIYDANPNLASMGLDIPIGTKIKIPDFEIDQLPVKTTVNLWD